MLWDSWLEQSRFMTRLKHYNDLGTARFVTFTCYYRLPSLRHQGGKEIVIGELDQARAKHGFLFLGHVLMPHHVQLVLFPADRMKLGQAIGEIKSRSARRYLATAEVGLPKATQVLWQRRCYDHNWRTPETVRQKIPYCHNNPVKRVRSRNRLNGIGRVRIGIKVEKMYV